jgi:hypothetical protein
MKFTAREVVRGISNMTYPNDKGGEPIVSRAVHVDVTLAKEHGGKGTRTDAMRVDNEDVIKTVEHNTFPFVADLEVEQRATKGKTSLYVTGIKPVPQQAVKAAQA